MESRVAPFEADVVTALARWRGAGGVPFEDQGVDAARATYRAGRETSQLRPLPVAEVANISLGGARAISARLYRPLHVASNHAAPAILFFHGGGWVIGGLDTHDGICRRLARQAARTLIAVDYRLAPEHIFPAAVDDVTTAHGDIVARAQALRIDPADIALAGDSAGGALAIVSAIMAREGGMLQKPSALLLFYPVTDLRGETASYKSVKNVPITAATLHWFRDNYLRGPDDVHDWRASPLLASSLESLPPCFLTSAGHDPLCDEAFNFAERLRIAGNTVHHRHLPGQVHGYLTLGRIVKEAERSIDAAASFLLHLDKRTL